MKKITLLMLIAFTITLHGQNKLLSSIDENYDGFSWQIQSGNNYEYDSNNNLISDTFISWNGSNWEYSSKDNYSYNANNKTTQNIYQNWNSTTQQYDNSYKELYIYNISGDVTQILYQNWIGSQWVNDSKTDIFYNSNNLINNYTSFTWDGSQWVGDYRGTVTYNSNNKIISSMDEVWNVSQWENSNRTFLTYNGNGKIMTYTDEVWNGSGWDNDYTVNYNFDSNGNTTSYTENYGVGQSKTEYSYDTLALMSSFAHPFKDKTGIDYVFEDFPYVNKKLSETSFIYDNGSYVNSNRTTYNYSNSITLSTENYKINTEKVKIFPNPSKNSIQVSGLSEAEAYEVFSVLGAKVNNGKIADNEKIDIQNLTNGLYFLKFKNGNTIKFIKE